MTFPELRVRYERLRAEHAERLRELERRGAENAELRQKLAELERRLAEDAELRRKLEETERRLAEAHVRIAELRRKIYGSRAERLDDEQKKALEELARTLEEQARRPGAVGGEILAAEEETDPKRGPRRPRRSRRHPLPDDLETETVVLEPERCPCPRCGGALEKIGEEVTEEIDRIPAKLIRRRIVRPKYACRCGEAGVAVAALPPRLIPQSRLGPGLAVHIVLARFDDHLSYYWLERQLRERHGVVVARQQMVQWVERIAFWLQPLYEALWREMIGEGYLQVDETPVRVLDPDVKGKAARGYLWFFAVPGGDVLLRFDRSRGLEPVRRQLDGFAGTIQTDAYEVYHALERREAVQRIGCLAHARRYFYRALGDHGEEALWFILRIGLLYRIEDEARDLPPAERRAYRRARAPAVWEDLKRRVDELKDRLLPRSSLGKAVNYFLNEYEALLGYLRDGRFEIDNNLVENDIRPTAVGRKRWLFIGHPDAGWRSAVIYSILVSCRRRGVNPRDYLNDVLGRLPSLKQHELTSLLPGNWKPTPPDTG
jgi:transposase